MAHERRPRRNEDGRGAAAGSARARVRAAAASGADLVGVDLLPDGNGGWTVLELNGAVDFTRDYRIDRDPFVAAAAELARRASEPVAVAAPDPLAAESKAL